MATTEATLAASQRYEQRARNYLDEHFPGTTDIRWRPAVTLSTDGSTDTLIGNWKGVWINVHFIDSNPWVAQYSECECCRRFARSCGARALDGADLVTGAAPTTVAQCYACMWLHRAQAAAATTGTGRFAQWRFARTYGIPTADVLARHARNT